MQPGNIEWYEKLKRSNQLMYTTLITAKIICADERTVVAIAIFTGLKFYYVVL